MSHIAPRSLDERTRRYNLKADGAHVGISTHVVNGEPRLYVEFWKYDCAAAVHSEHEHRLTTRAHRCEGSGIRGGARHCREEAGFGSKPVLGAHRA